jgi:tellurite resistance protein TerC
MHNSVGTPALWIGFSIGVVALLVLDLLVFHRREHEVRMREALIWSGVWIGLALAFNYAVYVFFGSDKAAEFLTGYLIEKALSVDNLFVFVVILSYFAVPLALQHRVLFWGIIGALVARAVFIALGAALLERVHAVIYVFGGFLVFTGIKLLFQREENVHPERNPVLRVFRRLVPSVPEYHGPAFTVVQAGKRYATPLLMVVVVIEASDIMFAVDSIPAVFAVTRDPFIVYTSNIFAILGLRALYFVLARVIGQLRFLKVGLSCVLVFVGAKMLVSEVYEMPIWISLGVVVGLIGGSALASVLVPRRPHELGPGGSHESVDTAHERPAHEQR